MSGLYVLFSKITCFVFEKNTPTLFPMEKRVDNPPFLPVLPNSTPFHYTLTLLLFLPHFIFLDITCPSLTVSVTISSFLSSSLSLHQIHLAHSGSTSSGECPDTARVNLIGDQVTFFPAELFPPVSHLPPDYTHHYVRFLSQRRKEMEILLSVLDKRVGSRHSLPSSVRTGERFLFSETLRSLTTPFVHMYPPRRRGCHFSDKGPGPVPVNQGLQVGPERTHVRCSDGIVFERGLYTDVSFHYVLL